MIFQEVQFYAHDEIIMIIFMLEKQNVNSLSIGGWLRQS